MKQELPSLTLFVPDIDANDTPSDANPINGPHTLKLVGAGGRISKTFYPTRTRTSSGKYVIEAGLDVATHRMTANLFSVPEEWLKAIKSRLEEENLDTSGLTYGVSGICIRFPVEKKKQDRIVEIIDDYLQNERPDCGDVPIIYSLGDAVQDARRQAISPPTSIPR